MLYRKRKHCIIRRIRLLRLSGKACLKKWHLSTPWRSETLHYLYPQAKDMASAKGLRQRPAWLSPRLDRGQWGSISIIIITKCQPEKTIISSSLCFNVTFVNLCLAIISNYCINAVIRYNLWYDQHSQVSGFSKNPTPTEIVYYYRSFLPEPNMFNVGFHMRNIPNQNVTFYE